MVKWINYQSRNSLIFLKLLNKLKNYIKNINSNINYVNFNGFVFKGEC